MKTDEISKVQENPFEPVALFVCSFLAALGGAWAIRATDGDTLVLAVTVIAALPIYFMPSHVARGRKNASAIFALNLLLGWTVVAWAIALVWALKKD